MLCVVNEPGKYCGVRCSERGCQIATNECRAAFSQPTLPKLPQERNSTAQFHYLLRALLTVLTVGALGMESWLCSLVCSLALFSSAKRYFLIFSKSRFDLRLR